MTKQNLINLVNHLEGLTDAINKIIAEMSDEVPTSKPNKSADVEPAETETPKEIEEVEGHLDLEQLSKMKFADLKKLARDMGISTEGTRKEIIERVAKAKVSAPAEEAETEEEVPTEDEYMQTAKALAEDNSDDEIKEVLTEAGVKVSKKADHDKIIELLSDALRKGLIDLDEEDDEEVEESDDEAEEAVEPDDSPEEDEPEGEETEDESDETEDINENTYSPEFDPEGFNAPAIMTAKRAKAVKKMMKQTITAIEKGDIDRDTITDYISDILTEDEFEGYSDFDDDELIKLYLEIKKRFVDNEGEIHEPNDPYELGEDNFCCGHPLKYDKKNKTYICEVCGQDYEAE